MTRHNGMGGHDVTPLPTLSPEQAVIAAAKAWRIGRDRDVIGTAPSGGERSATGIALIDAVDALALADVEAKP